MNRTNKLGNWCELLVLSKGYFIDNSEDSGVAVKITFAKYGDEMRFSYIPGVIGREDQFKPVQNLHDRNIETYSKLFDYAQVGVNIAKEYRHVLALHVLDSAEDDFEHLMAAIQRNKFKGLLRKTLQELEQKIQKNPQTKPIEKEIKTLRTKPSFGSSIGEMLKAKNKAS